MKRRIWIPALFLLLLTACRNPTGDWDSGNIVFINNSHVPVSSVSVSCEGETQGGSVQMVPACERGIPFPLKW